MRQELVPEPDRPWKEGGFVSISVGGGGVFQAHQRLDQIFVREDHSTVRLGRGGGGEGRRLSTAGRARALRYGDVLYGVSCL